MTTHSRRTALILTGVLLGGPLLFGCGLEHENQAFDETNVRNAPAEDVVDTPATRSYEWSNSPAPLILALPSGDVRLNPISTCWQGPAGEDGVSAGMCADGVPREMSRLESVGALDTVAFWFGRPGWEFEASFSQDLPGEAPPETIKKATVTRTGPQDFTIKPAPGLKPGDYRVSVFGHGPEGDLATDFAWTVG